ncbi:metallophosphoesterase family protein [Urbifossiella limnaea]|uniref:Calcineurin-like phosphoesterase superfamily domain protein n=1 Tax=Urbifossiella limnaea TaxID=2528023 RepID=A0A517XTQ5_9BACT|nr:metallophosphoesterase [Urbifossiella limnaea]QDU20896.1 Calcineurin-like phosphoesterase superfamily domain protein [Urbifossiella limnaea]
MRIGVVTDIHDAAEELARALAVLRTERVDAVVCLGDATDQFGPRNRAAEVATLFRDAGAKLVWGNHDHGLCHDSDPVVKARYDADTLATFASASPRIELAGCHFSHVEPWIDAHDPAALWHFGGLPRTDEMLGKTFASFPHRAAFVGHHHCWFATTPTGRVSWDGSAPLRLAAEDRYLIVVAPIFQRSFAVVDTDRGVVIPHTLPDC